MLCTFYGGYCSLWPNRTARSLSRAWPSLLRAHNHIGGATAVPLHHKKCLLCSVLIYIVLDPSANWYHRKLGSYTYRNANGELCSDEIKVYSFSAIIFQTHKQNNASHPVNSDGRKIMTETYMNACTLRLLAMRCCC